MKTLLATIMGLAIVVVANPASAYVVAITTSIPATSVADDTDLKAALVSAIDDVLRHAIAFSPPSSRCWRSGSSTIGSTSCC